jgi:hypothetical protein
MPVYFTGVSNTIEVNGTRRHVEILPDINPYFFGNPYAPGSGEVETDSKEDEFYAI